MAMLRMAQYATKHGHAAGKLSSMRRNPDVELVGVFEPDEKRRRQLAHGDSPYRDVRWFADESEMLDDPTIVAIASEGRNDESLDHTERIAEAGKHVWYDKPAGDDWSQWRRVAETASQNGLIIQMGYMFRYHSGFRQIAAWAKDGLLGDIFAIRAHMSTCIPESSRQVISAHVGGILYDLAGHMLDQIVWLLGRPSKITSFLRNDTGLVPGFSDNTVSVLEYEKAIVLVDIAAMEPRPMARRFEVYGTRGSAIMEPLEPADSIRLCLEEPAGGYSQGVQIVPVEPQFRQKLYDLELDSFLGAISGKKPRDRTPEHEILVQETLLRATGALSPA